MRIKYFLKKIDKIASYFLIIFSIFLLLSSIIIIKKPIYALLALFILFTGISWLYLRKKDLLIENLDYCQNSNYYLILSTFFFILLLISVLIIQFRTNEYVRPLSYFVVTSFMAVIISLEILYSPSKKFNPLTIFQIIILGLSISISQLLIFPSVLGIDSWWHQMFTSLIINSSHIPSGGYPYAKIPIFHLLVTNNMLISGLDYKLSTIFSITIPLVLISVLLIFSIGKQLFNDKIGLLASLILVFSNYFINGEIMPIPTTLGGIFLLMILYFLINFNEKKIFLSSILSLFMMFILILTHTIISLELSILLFVGWLTIIIYGYLYNKSKNYFSLTLAICFTVAMLGWWIYASGTIIQIVSLISWGLNVDPSLAGTPSQLITYISHINIIEQIFINLGTFFLFSLSIIGLLFLISQKVTNDKRYLYGTISIIPLLIAFFSIISGHSVIEGRWFFIAEILLSIPIAISIISITNQFSNEKLKVLFLVIIIFPLSFLMIMNNNVSNIDNNNFYPDGTVRYALTNSELISFATINNVNNNIKTDEYYLNSNSNLILKSSRIKKDNSFSEEIYNNNITNYKNKIIIIRQEIDKNPFILYGTVYKLNYDINDALVDKFSILYDSGYVKGYYKTS